jgi:hypothetical protein
MVESWEMGCASPWALGRRRQLLSSDRSYPFCNSCSIASAILVNATFAGVSVSANLRFPVRESFGHRVHRTCWRGRGTQLCVNDAVQMKRAEKLFDPRSRRVKTQPRRGRGFLDEPPIQPEQTAKECTVEIGAIGQVDRDRDRWVLLEGFGDQHFGAGTVLHRRPAGDADQAGAIRCGADVDGGLHASHAVSPAP